MILWDLMSRATHDIECFECGYQGKVVDDSIVCPECGASVEGRPLTPELIAEIRAKIAARKARLEGQIVPPVSKENKG